MAGSADLTDLSQTLWFWESEIWSIHSHLCSALPGIISWKTWSENPNEYFATSLRSWSGSYLYYLFRCCLPALLVCQGQISYGSHITLQMSKQGTSCKHQDFRRVFIYLTSCRKWKGQCRDKFQSKKKWGQAQENLWSDKEQRMPRAALTLPCLEESSCQQCQGLFSLALSLPSLLGIRHFLWISHSRATGLFPPFMFALIYSIWFNETAPFSFINKLGVRN